jgi:hypothetical protein
MRTPIALAAFLALISSALAGNWPAWRGPNGDGTTPETDLPLTWTATAGVKWKIDLPERGNSTPIVWGDRIYAVTQNSDVVVFKASPEKYEQLAVNPMADGLTNSSLAVSDGQLFLRTHRHLWCIGK